MNMENQAKESLLEKAKRLKAEKESKDQSKAEAESSVKAEKLEALNSSKQGLEDQLNNLNSKIEASRSEAHETRDIMQEGGLNTDEEFKGEYDSTVSEVAGNLNELRNEKNRVKAELEQINSNIENFEVNEAISEGKEAIQGAVENANQENEQIIAQVESYPGAEAGDIKAAEEVVAETNQEVNHVTENSEKIVSEVVGEDNEVNQEKYKKLHDTLASNIDNYGDEKIYQSNLESFKQKFNLLDDESIQDIDKEVAFLEGDGRHINVHKILDKAIQDYKHREVSNLTKGMPQELNAGQKFNFIQNKLNDLDDKGQLHGISAGQLTSLFHQVLRGEKTIADLDENTFTLNKNKFPLSLRSVAQKILLNDVVPILSHMEALKRVAKTLDLGGSYIEDIESIENGKYVTPSGDLAVLVEKANEIIGLKKPAHKPNSDSPWTDLHNPPTRWDKNARIGDKIRK